MNTQPVGAHPPAHDPFFTLNAAADYLSVSRAFLQKLIYETKELEAVRIAGSRNTLRIRKSALDALVVAL